MNSPCTRKVTPKRGKKFFCFARRREIIERSTQGRMESNMDEKIRAKLEDLRGMLQADGGDLEVVAINGKAVQLRLKGACGGCPHATMTIKQGIERILREEIDAEITVTQVK